MPQLLVAAIGAAVPATTATAFTIGAGATATAVSYATIAGYAAFTALTVGAQYALAQQPKQKTQPFKSSLKQGVTARFFVLGRAQTAGAYHLHEAIPGGYYELGLIVNCEPIHAFNTIWKDGRKLTWTPPAGGHGSFTGNDGYGTWPMDVTLGRAAGYVPSTTLTNMPVVWSSAHLCCNLAAFYGHFAQVPGDQRLSKYPNAFPQMRFDISGRHWDWRDVGQDQNDDSTWLPSSNPIVLAVNYIMHAEGPIRAVAADIDFTAATAAADACDATVAGYGAATEKFAEAFTIWSTDEEGKAVLGRLLAACDGSYGMGPDGKWVFRIGEYHAPTITFTEADIVGIRIDSAPGLAGVVNKYKVSYRDPEKNYESNETFAVEDAASQAVDGVRDGDMDFPCVTSPTQAYRMATRYLRRSLDARRLVMRTGPVGEIGAFEISVAINAPRLGVTGDFAVEKCSGDSINGFVYELRETKEAHFADVTIPADPTESIPLVGDISVPEPVLTYDPVPSGGTPGSYYLELTINDPATYFKRGDRADEDYTIEAEYSAAGSGGPWTAYSIVVSDFVRRSGTVAAGSYDSRVRLGNKFGVVSPWVETLSPTVVG